MSPIQKLDALALDLYRNCRELPADRYQLWALDRIKTDVPFDAAKWVSGHMDPQGPVIHNVVLANRPPEMLADYDKIKREDILTYESVANPNSARLANSVAERRDLSPSMVAYLGRWRITHAAGICVIDPFTDLATGIGLWREAPDAPFSEDDRSFFEAAMPHLIESYAINRITHVVRATQPKNAAIYASAVSDPDGRLHVAPQNFLRMMLLEWPDWSGHRLPAELDPLAAEAEGARYIGSQVFFRSSRVGDLLLLQARNKLAADELTVREREIAQLAANGRSYREVADHLTISSATVRTHLSSIYKKLDVHKQAGIASKLRDAE